MPNIEQRRHLWYAVLVIPTDVRDKLGKFKFIQSLETPDKRLAQERAAPLVAKWKAIIKRERGDTDAVTREALRWSQHLRELESDSTAHETISGLAIDRAEEIEKKSGLDKAHHFADIALGHSIPSDFNYEEWLATQVPRLAAKTIDQMRKDVPLLTARFPTLSQITSKNVALWFDEMATKGRSESSCKRIVSNCRSYWKHLQGLHVVPKELDPFSGLGRRTKGKRNAKAGGWEPFKPDEVVSLWSAAKASRDSQLADLIALGAYTGARIEELCSLKVGDVNEGSMKITGAKTRAGIREVPIHPALSPLITRLKKESKDGHLLSGLTLNKYGDRSNAIGKRFGRLKTAQGFSEAHVFHSIRKTLVTVLENAKVSENLAADIVGHDKPRITYGLYSGGALLTTKAKAVRLIAYPFPRGGIK